MSACTHGPVPGRGWATRAEARVREVTTVQLQPQHLRAGRLPVVAVGETLEVAPVPMRGRYRLAAVRRHRPVPDGPPREERLDRVPAPEDVDPEVFLHVADLVGPVRAQP